MMTTLQLSSGNAMPERIRRIETLDLEPVMVKLMEVEDGEGWSLQQCLETARWYKRFLQLHLLQPGQSIVPNKQIDTFWHYHILDTMKYQQDCAHVFGYFLHHFPYFGLRGEADAQQLERAYKETLQLFGTTFNESPETLTEVFAKNADCHSGCDSGPGSCHVSCYGACHSSPEVAHVVRPTLGLGGGIFANMP